MKHTVIYHRADYDGLFSAAVCAKFLPDDTEFIGWDFGDELVSQDRLGKTVYIVDLPPSCIKDFKGPSRDGLSSFVWIDHHKSSISQWDRQFEYQPYGFRIDGVAACRLCWQWFVADASRLLTLDDYKNRSVDEPFALTLAGEYDVWDLSDRRSTAFQYGLAAARLTSFRDLAPLLERGGDSLVDELCVHGDYAKAWHENFAATVMRERSYRLTFEGLSFAVLASVHARNSLWFPQSEIETGVDALMNWRYSGAGRVDFSLYHAPGQEHYDLSIIATKYGGGGHRGACGFSLPLDQALEIIR